MRSCPAILRIRMICIDVEKRNDEGMASDDDDDGFISDKNIIITMMMTMITIMIK